MRDQRAEEAGIEGQPEEGDPVVDEAVIEQLASITDGQGFSVLGELLNAFLDAVPPRLTALEGAADASDLAAVADQAHALTGSAASFGARRMAARCRELRSAAIRGDVGSARPIVKDLHEEFVLVRSWLIDFRGRP
jgi:two-component system, sensor histidine kinase and response regulator